MDLIKSLPFEKGGRVGLQGGGIPGALLFAIKELMKKYGPNIVKLAKDVKPSKKWDTQKAIQAFKDRNPEFKAEGGRTGFYLGGPVWKKFAEKLFLKASNDIRQGKGLFKGLAQKDWIKLHDDLTKKLVEFQQGGYKKLPKDMKKFFGMNDIQIMNKYKISTGQIKPSFSLSKEKLMNRFPNMTKQQVDELMGKTVDEQKQALDQLMKLEKFNPVIKHAEGGIIGLNAGGPLNTQALIQLYMSEGMTEEEATAAAGASANLPWNILTDKAEGGRVPMWLGGGLGVGKSLLREMLKYFSKGSTHGKSPVEMLKMLNPKQFNEMLNTPGGIPALAKEMIEKYTKTIKKERAESIGDIISSAKNIKKADDAVIAHKKWMIEDMVKKGSDRKTAEMFADGLSKAMAKTGKDTPKITERGLLELENIHKNLVTKGRPLNAEGGLAKMLGE